MRYKQFIICLLFILCSLKAFSQNNNPETVQEEARKFLLLQQELLLPKNLYVPTKVYLKHKKLPFFCDLELQLEAAAKMPVKFRLGEVQQVERLEGKH